MNTGNRNITLKDIILSTLAVSYLLTTIVVFFLYSKIVGLILFILAGCYISYELPKLPAESKQKIAEKLKKQDESLFGRFFKILGYLILGYLIYALVASSLN